VRTVPTPKPSLPSALRAGWVNRWERDDMSDHQQPTTSGPIRKLIRADGVEQYLARPHSVREISNLIRADALDTVLLADRAHVMLVDDAGHHKGLPVNDTATRLYWERCGKPNPHVIRGDVVIVPDSDFGA